MPIGVLALQGNFAVHAAMIQSLGEHTRLIKNPSDLAGCEGLVIPGGESTTMLKLMGDHQVWFSAIRDFAKDHWLFGTCAGMILLASHVDPDQASLGLIGISVKRNAYGRQIDSRIVSLPYQNTEGEVHDSECVFIRAPMVESVSDSVDTILKDGDTPILCQQGNVMVASFHPESSVCSKLYADCIKRLRVGVGVFC